MHAWPSLHAGRVNVMYILSLCVCVCVWWVLNSLIITLLPYPQTLTILPHPRRPRRIHWHHTSTLLNTVSRSGLRSTSTSLMDYALPRLRTKFGERAFSHAGPATWNALPDNVRTVADPVKFRRLLKSHYFRTAFSVCWTVYTVMDCFY